MPIAGPASAPVRARPLTVAARVGALWDEAEAGLTRLRRVFWGGRLRWLCGASLHSSRLDQCGT